MRCRKSAGLQQALNSAADDEPVALKATGIVEPLVKLIESHLMAGSSLQMDETTMKVVGVEDREKPYGYTEQQRQGPFAVQYMR